MSDQMEEFSRRVFLSQMLLAGAIPLVVKSSAQASSILDTSNNTQIREGKNCFLINGKPTFLLCGSIDYFRCPHELWRDRILKAKRAGLNCIASYIAWNYHELEDGKFDFTGDRDLGRFIDICHDLGMYFFARVGPFICAEWEAGGHPAWLIGRPETRFRTYHPPTLRYVHRWFEQLIPQIASRQITRGGPVILVQQENEFFFPKSADGMRYLEYLIKTLRELGIEVPITDCNGFENRPTDSLQTINGFGVASVNRFRQGHPSAPLLISEHYTDWIDCWNWPSTSYPPADALHQQTMQALSLRVMYSYFMFYGGTNFGFWASNTWKSDHSFVTTRYFGESPIAEGGALNEKYFATKSVNLLGSNFNDLISSAQPANCPLEFNGPVKGTALQTPQGTLIFVLPQHPVRADQVFRSDGQPPLVTLAEDRPSADVSAQHGSFRAPSGVIETLAESSAQPSMLPFNLQIDSSCRIDWANATLLGTGGTPESRVLIFRGDARSRGVASINKQIVEWVFTESGVVETRIGKIILLGISREAADRAWFADNRILIGPAFVGETRPDNQHECWLDEGQTEIHLVSQKGEYSRQTVEQKSEALENMRLGNWEAFQLSEIRGAEENRWREIDGPRSVEELGAPYGYTWYRASYPSSQPRVTTLLPTNSSDRLHVFLNGEKAGVWGRGAAATRDPLGVKLRSGQNEFVFLCDNMGRSSEGQACERKGIRGPAYLGAQAKKLSEATWSRPSGPATDSFDFRTFQSFSNNRFEYSEAAWSVEHGDYEGLILSLRWVPQFTWIFVNDSLVGEHGGDFSLIGGMAFNEFNLSGFLHGTRSQIKLRFYGEPVSGIEQRVRLFTYPRSMSLRKWGFKSWENPTVAQSVASKKGEPVWWRCTVKETVLAPPLFLYPRGLSKGHFYLNGMAVGRYWQSGPQESFYLPEPWWKSDSNVIEIFDEEGKQPGEVYLARDARYPLHKITI